MTSHSILALPPELVENILISTAAGGFPQAIASFAQTCKVHYALIYHTTDNHLWREIFLTTFDDPRASGGGPGWGQCMSSHSQARLEETFDWSGEFKRRVWAAGYIRWQSDPVAKDAVDPVTDLEQTLRNTCAFDTILSVMRSAMPCPPTLVFSFLDCPDAGPNLKINTSSSYPTFPPLPQAIGTPNPMDTHGRVFGQSLRASNTAWLESVLEKGLPLEITAMFSGDRWAGGLVGQFLSDPELREVQAAAHIIACTGFIPAPQPDPSPTSPTDREHSPPVMIGISPARPSGSRASSWSSGSTVQGPPAGSYMTLENQLKRARRLARMRVYNMRYLARNRHWGPFLPFSDGRRAADAVADDDELLQPILALFRVTPNSDLAHTHDDGDEEVVERGWLGGEEEEEDEEEEGSVLAESASRDDAPEEVLSSAQLYADWAYLAAVRVVVEANLRESFQVNDLRGLFSLDGLRRGSAPYDWTAYRPPSPVETKDEKGKGRIADDDTAEVEGWDWAGVTGVWKRCICWLDYRDLILHNLSGEFEDPHLQEAVRIISMRLRIKSYSKSEIPEYAHLPTIHFVGETTGATIHGQPRSLHGTVSVIADGSVRWVLYSSVEGGEMDEWLSEGVQVGGVASAMGVLGLWTGAQHERMDPLGPCWSWKVG
ncbi:hypothetical protein GSI_05205 [Ganoderma sinense ZZ0214-1]|uniref:F-box domain-containing protein n=1 Tax=Ganoderma sinense ZZ0214-1 TaxID=1077348 RepID=A0A2G8SFF7_9APHY|nr:hypothetical protein GSI_05205 [Ganoderma sinense ZZ0214-1]